MLLTLEEQKRFLNQENNFISVQRSAQIGDGILSLNQEEKQQYINHFERTTYSACSFIPASGAASRMFKDLRVDSKQQSKFLTRLKDFAFYSTSIKNIEDVLTQIATLPKGLIAFHKNGQSKFTPVEEHVKDALEFIQKDKALHFTISKNAKDQFTPLFKYLEKKYGVKISASFQNEQTNTVAVDHSGKLVTDEHQNLLKRPAGHGALLENLNSIDAELIFINNIDNIQKDAHKAKVIKTKKIIGGLLCEFIEKRLQILADIEKQIFDAASHIEFLKKWHLDQSSTNQLIEQLDRPARVCGMVKNQGAPGGGPFWVRSEQQNTLQIVEKVHLDLNHKDQKEALGSSTHFNPVNIACHIYDVDQKKYDLSKYVNREAFILSQKDHQGTPIKIIEYPGLWNGSMHNWNTLFIDVEASTFTPVKTVFDLLNEFHA